MKRTEEIESQREKVSKERPMKSWREGIHENRSKNQCQQRKTTTHPRRPTHPDSNHSSARKRDIQLIQIKQVSITRAGRRNAEFIFNELGGCGCEWEGGDVVFLPGRG